MEPQTIATFTYEGYELTVLYFPSGGAFKSGMYSLYDDEGQPVSGSFQYIDEMFNWANDYVDGVKS